MEGGGQLQLRGLLVRLRSHMLTHNPRLAVLAQSIVPKDDDWARERVK